VPVPHETFRNHLMSLLDSVKSLEIHIFIQTDGDFPLEKMEKFETMNNNGKCKFRIECKLCSF
jgi:hypothetical protein